MVNKTGLMAFCCVLKCACAAWRINETQADLLSQPKDENTE